MLSDILKILDKEKRLNYSNSSVFGGIGGLASKWERQLKSLSSSPQLPTDIRAALSSVLMTLTKISLYYDKGSRVNRQELLSELETGCENLLKLIKSSSDKITESLSETSKSELQLIDLEEIQIKLRPLRKRIEDLSKSQGLPPDGDITLLKGIGRRTAEKLRKLGIYKLEDILYLYPRKYIDRREPKPFKELLGLSGYLRLEVIGSPELNDTSSGKSIVKFPVKDTSGDYGWLVFFNQVFITRVIRKGMKLKVYGRVDKFRGEFQVIPEEWTYKERSDVFDRIIPVYPLTEGITQNFIRKLVIQALQNVLPHLEDPLPEELRDKLGLLELRESLALIHVPIDWDLLKIAKYRLAFQEAFIPQLAIQSITSSPEENRYVIDLDFSEELLNRFKETLPFKLTGAQERVISEILRDMASLSPMKRLVQGDVGSGKTVVAAAAVAVIVKHGWQASVMAPTEVLANQHFQNFKKYLEPLGVKVELLTGRIPEKRKREVKERAERGEVDLVVGTHALISENVKFKRLALVVIDEQHKFGVEQRAKLYSKGETPHLLVLTATPIPRTLAMTVYADLDLSIIDEMPPGRKPVKTKVIPFKRLNEAYQFIRELIEKGEKAYIVCPAIDESSQALRTVMEEAKYIKEEVFPDFKVGILHGKMSSQEKEEIIRAFREGDLQVLVSTTVVEVGVDVPTATVMMVLNADRFGLAQLHQLRGRVGRGDKQSYAIFVASPKNPKAIERLKALEIYSDGFSIAQKDLEIRGPGEVIGQRQHGYWDFKLLDPIRDVEIISKAREMAKEILPQLEDYPKLYNEVKLYLESKGLIEGDLKGIY